MTGAQGALASGGTWSVFRDYTFFANSNQVLREDEFKAHEVARYLSLNPSYGIALDGANPERVEVVRQEMLAAGIPASKIQVGAYGDPAIRSNNRVVILITD